MLIGGRRKDAAGNWGVPYTSFREERGIRPRLRLRGRPRKRESEKENVPILFGTVIACPGAGSQPFAPH